MKNIIELINESTKKSKYTIEDLKQAIEYLEEYYKEFPEENGNYPNWGEIDNYFKNEKFCKALMDGDNDPIIKIIDKIVDVFYDVND